MVLKNKLILVTFRPLVGDVETMYDSFDKWMQGRCLKSALVKEANPNGDGFHLHGLYMYSTDKINFNSNEKKLVLNAGRSRIQKRFPECTTCWGVAFDVKIDNEKKNPNGKKDMLAYMKKMVSDEDMMLRDEFTGNEFTPPVKYSFIELSHYNEHVYHPKWFYWFDGSERVLQNVKMWLDSDCVEATGVAWGEGIGKCKLLENVERKEFERLEKKKEKIMKEIDDCKCIEKQIDMVGKYRKCLIEIGE